MNTKKIDMKRFLMLTGALLCMLFVSESALATSYYACLEASVGNPSNVGKVYVGTSENASQADRVYGYTASSSSENGTTTLKAWAYPATGYELYKWEFVSAVRYTKTKNSNHTAADITGTESPLSVTLCCPSGSKDKSDLSSILTVRAVFWRPGGVNVDKLTFRTTEHGKYSVRSIAKDGVEQTTYDYTDIRDTKKEVSNVITGMPIDCRATADDGYIFYSYYTLDKYGNKAYVGDLLEPNQVILIEDDVVELGAEFTDNAFRIGDTFVKTLSDALQFVRTSDVKTIQVVRSHEIPNGYYTIPAGVTLLIPYDVRHTTPKTVIERYDNNASIPKTNYRKLSLPSGAHLDVFGAIEVGGRQNCYDNVGTGRPVGTYYGQLDMATGSTITLETGANLYAWGFVTGAGEIDVRRGACVHEDFQIYDWHGGGQASTFLGNTQKVFVVSSYSIQNVEVAAKYRPGSALYCYTGLVGVGIDKVKVIGIVGDAAAMFQMNDNDDSEDTWVRKSYNFNTDQQVYEINNAAKLGNLVINYDSYSYNSSSARLPITNNMKIHLLSGSMNVTQDAVLLPGAEIEIDKKATVYIDKGSDLFLIDSADWGKWLFGTVYAYHVEVRPDNVLPGDNQRKIENADGSCALPSAKMNIHGTFVANGDIYTSYAYYIEEDKTGATSNLGASIVSTNDDAGTIIFNHKAPTSEKSVYARRYKDAWPEMKCVSAKLKNADGSYATTAGTDSLKSFCYQDNRWRLFTVDPDSISFVYDNYGTYYAKPGEYVAINATKNPSTKIISGNDDHTYSDVEGTGRLFILVDGQWWEVANVDNLYKCEKTGISYTWNNTKNVWEEKKYAISWVDYDGTPLLDANNDPIVYHLSYGAKPKFLSTSPTRSADIDYYYDFKGWSPAITDETKVTGDQTYMAVYEKIPVKYEIVFKYEEGIKQGSVIKREFLPRESMPTPPVLYPIEGYESYKWTPAISAVKGNQTYEAKWIEKAPAKYEIRFVDYNGTELKKDSVLANTMPTPPANPANKPSTLEYSYAFDHWQPALAAATSDATYTAVYEETQRTYDIRFYQEDGTTQIGGTQSLVLGADPVVPNYSKANTDQYTFQLQWKNKATGEIVGVSVPSVSGAADYVADFIVTINKYTIQANCQDENGNPVNGCTFTGAGTYNYGTGITLTAVPNEGYEFVKWKIDDNTDPARNFNVAGNVTYTAIVRGAPVMKVRNDETKVVEEGTKVSALVISATPTSSTDLVNANNLVGANNETTNNIPVSFDLTRGAGKVFKHHTWYAFSVPFQVDAAEILFDGQTMQYGQTSKKDDYDILYYDGSVRAAQGKAASCWKYVEKDDPTYLYPGKLYMIANTRRDVTTLRFTKVAGSALLNTSVDVNSYSSTTGHEADANWNGIANPAVFHADMSGLEVAAGQVYVYNPDFTDPTNAYIPLNLNTDKIILGEAFFAQIPSTRTFSVNSSPASAPYRRSPARAKVNKEGYYQISVAESGKASTDEIIIRMDEDKAEDTYIIGQDLTRMGMSTINPQIWVNRYNEKLRVNVMAPVNGQASYPLGIFAPNDGEYQISVAQQPDNETTLYLTLDGKVIWNLNYNPYTATLTKGNTDRYGLLMVGNKAPEIATGVDEAVVDANGATRKVLINNHIYIIRGDQVYTINGQKIR